MVVFLGQEFLFSNVPHSYSALYPHPYEQGFSNEQYLILSEQLTILHIPNDIILSIISCCSRHKNRK
jgi:hypothetical protein